MSTAAVVRRKLLAVVFAAAFVTLASAPAVTAGRQLKYVVIISRHGVRAPTWDATRLNQYSTEPWPSWGVGPGELTPRGSALISELGAYYRAWLSKEGLTRAVGCREPRGVYIWADNDQRTLESGRAMARGLSPDCPEQIHSSPAHDNDPLFDPIAAGLAAPDLQRSAQAIRDRLHERSDFVAAHGDAFDALRRVLVHGDVPPAKTIPTPSAITITTGPRGVEVTEALATASTFSENFLLEYANGMAGTNLGWGRLDVETLRNILQLHGSYADLMRRTPYVARARSSHMLARVLRSMQQSVAGQPMTDAMGSPAQAALILAGHDTNQSNLSGMLGLTWHLPGYQADETPPGGALVFSLWNDSAGQSTVTAEFVAQTLEQMRSMQPLTLAAPPARQTVLIPGCGDSATACPWQTFERLVEQAIDWQFTTVKPLRHAS